MGLKSLSIQFISAQMLIAEENPKDSKDLYMCGCVHYHIVIQTNSTPDCRMWGINICKSLLYKEVPIMKSNIICKHCLGTPALINTIADGSRLNISHEETPEALLVYEQLLNLKRKFYPGCLLLF